MLNIGILAWTLRCLKRTFDHSLLFEGLVIKSYWVDNADKSHVGDLDANKFTSGYVFLGGSCCICWRRKPQSESESSTEAEFIVLNGVAD